MTVKAKLIAAAVMGVVLFGVFNIAAALFGALWFVAQAATLFGAGYLIVDKVTSDKKQITR